MFGMPVCKNHNRSMLQQGQEHGMVYGFRPRRLCRAGRSLPGCRVHARGQEMASLWTPREDRRTVLVADVGGTNCRFELCEIVDGKEAATILAQSFETKNYPTFGDAVAAFSALDGFSENMPSAAAFAVAGPVSNNKCVMTNLDWTIDGPALSKTHGIKVAVLNDFEANGYGIPTLTSSDVLPIHDVPHVPQAPAVVMGPGTGLGEAYLTWNEATSTYKVFPSEGSHATFGPNGSQQRDLHAFVESRLGQCEIEYIACGSGLELIYDFLFAKGKEEGSQKCVKAAPEITKAALDGSDPLAVECLDLFLEIIGTEAGNCALKFMARGGIYLCGGILPRVKDIVLQGGVREAFLNKAGRFAPVLKTIPLYLVNNTNLGVRGTINYAAQLSRQRQ